LSGSGSLNSLLSVHENSVVVPLWDEKGTETAVVVTTLKPKTSSPVNTTAGFTVRFFGELIEGPNLMNPVYRKLFSSMTPIIYGLQFLY